MPYNGYEKSTLDEIKTQENADVQKFFECNIRDETPGLLITRRPIGEKDSWKNAVYFSLAHVEHPFPESKQIISNVNKYINNAKFRRTLLSLNKFVKLEPNLFGIGFNLNNVIERMLRA
jgi:hypothetical protein